MTHPEFLVYGLATLAALDEDRQRSLDSGMDDRVSKPFGLDDRANVIARWAGLATTAMLSGTP